MRAHVLLVLASLAAAPVAACGGATGTGPSVPSGQPSGTPSTAASTPAATTAPAVPATTGVPSTTTTATPPAASVEMKALVPTALVADLQTLGVDAKSLPPIDKLEPKSLRGVMKLFARSLGVKCQDCHVEGDFAAPTRRKRIAAKMWDELAAKVTMPDGSPVFCDSCHQGRIKLLDRTDKKALGKWMDANFVDVLERKDGKAEECESCHVDMDMHFLSKWGVSSGK